jgi:hypothetical protein
LIFLQKLGDKPIELVKIASQEFLILRRQHTGSDMLWCARECPWIAGGRSRARRRILRSTGSERAGR